MFAAASLVALGLAASVFADPAPLTPQTGVEGQPCVISWTPDTTGTWNQTVIELMTGQNQLMVHLTTVATVDTTSTTNTSYTWTCPQVTLHAPVYFYQFSHAANASEFAWTTRWGIEAPSGTLDAAPTPTQPDGSATPWGIGLLVDAAAASPAPTYIVGESSAPTTGAVAITPSSVPVASVTGSGAALPIDSASSGTKATVTASSSSSASTANAANSASSVKLQGTAMAAAGLIAAAFMAFA